MRWLGARMQPLNGRPRKTFGCAARPQRTDMRADYLVCLIQGASRHILDRDPAFLDLGAPPR
jgi:hypothetical protein